MVILISVFAIRHGSRYCFWLAQNQHAAIEISRSQDSRKVLLQACAARSRHKSTWLYGACGGARLLESVFLSLILKA
jgi:uncharacterized protein (DUF58 family)